MNKTPYKWTTPPDANCVHAVGCIKCGLPLTITIVGGGGSGKDDAPPDLCARLREHADTLDAQGVRMFGPIADDLREAAAALEAKDREIESWKIQARLANEGRNAAEARCAELERINKQNADAISRYVKGE